MKRLSKALGDPGGRSFSAYGSPRPWCRIFSAYGGGDMSVTVCAFGFISELGCSTALGPLSTVKGQITVRLYI